jgi:hypothetical protein
LASFLRLGKSQFLFWFPLFLREEQQTTQNRATKGQGNSGTTFGHVKQPTLVSNRLINRVNVIIFYPGISLHPLALMGHSQVICPLKKLLKRLNYENYRLMIGCRAALHSPENHSDHRDQSL